MNTLPRKATTVAAVAALALTGATGVAHAEIDLGSVKIATPGNAGPNGSVDTSGSLIGEPTLGSLAGPVSEAIGSIGVNSVSPAPGTGLIDTTGSLIGEPTTGSLAPVTGEVVGAVRSASAGDTGSDSGSTAAVVLGVGSIAAIGAGIAFYPQIQQAAEDAGIALPPLP